MRQSTFRACPGHLTEGVGKLVPCPICGGLAFPDDPIVLCGRSDPDPLPITRDVLEAAPGWTFTARVARPVRAWRPIDGPSRDELAKLVLHWEDAYLKARHDPNHAAVIAVLLRALRAADAAHELYFQMFGNLG